MSKNIVQKIEKEIVKSKPVKSAEKYWKELGPGLITGAADDDPSGIATYSQTGAQFGFKFLWLAPITFPLMAIVQEMCARIGLVTGRGLAANIKRHYPRWLLFVVTGLLFLTNSFNLGADLGAMAKAVELLWPALSFPLAVILFALIILVLEIFVSYKRYSRYLKYLTLVLLTYVVSSFFVKFDLRDVLSGLFIPTMDFSRTQIFIVCAVLGTTISPYLFFWQTDEEIEEDIEKGEKTVLLRQLAATKKGIKRMRIDVWSGMFFSNLAMFFIILACAGTLFQNGITNIATAEQAAMALRPLAGNCAFFLFALGIIGTGLLAVPVLAGSASYAVSECFNWRIGLYRKLRQAKAFYGVITLSVLVGLALNFVGIDPMKALIYSAVANGVISPLIIFFIVRMSGSEAVMGKNKNNILTKILGWLLFAIMAGVGLAVVCGLII